MPDQLFQIKVMLSRYFCVRENNLSVIGSYLQVFLPLIAFGFPVESSQLLAFSADLPFYVKLRTFQLKGR